MYLFKTIPGSSSENGQINTFMNESERVRLLALLFLSCCLISKYINAVNASLMNILGIFLIWFDYVVEHYRKRWYEEMSDVL